MLAIGVAVLYRTRRRGWPLVALLGAYVGIAVVLAGDNGGSRRKPLTGESMTDTMTTPSTAGSATAGLLARMIGVIFSPKETFAAVVARPRWFGAIAVAVVVMGVAQFALLSTDVGKDLALDQNVTFMEAFGQTISDDAYAAMERRDGVRTVHRATRHDGLHSSVHVAQLPASCT